MDLHLFNSDRQSRLTTGHFQSWRSQSPNRFSRGSRSRNSSIKVKLLRLALLHYIVSNLSSLPDTAGRRLVLLGNIGEKPALLLVERAAFASSPEYLNAFSKSLAQINNLGTNDVYHWFMANVQHQSAHDVTEKEDSQAPDLKVNLIYPCTEKHVKKYTPQRNRFVVETKDIYDSYVRPYMKEQREAGRLNWVFNIVEGRTEQENVLYRSPNGTPDDQRFLLLPDLNWDRTTIGSLHLLALVERRDIWSVRDLRKEHVTWLREMVNHLTNVVAELYGKGGKMLKSTSTDDEQGQEGVEHDELKFYVHYQPTYYHFHIHIVHVGLEPGYTQAVGKAMGLHQVISTLDNLQSEQAGMRDLDLAYTLGEQSELWTRIFGPLKKGETPAVE